MAQLSRLFTLLIATLWLVSCVAVPTSTSSGNESLADYYSTDISRVLIRGHTTQATVEQRFGTPLGISHTNDGEWWTYTYRYQSNNLVGVKSLTVVFDRRGQLVDFDFADRRYQTTETN